MKNKTRRSVLMTTLLTLSLFAGCKFTAPVDEVLQENFVIDTTTRELSYGESFTVEPFSAKDKDGAWHDAVITVVDPDGNPCEVVDGAFTPTKLGNYTVTYTINYGEGGSQQMTKSFIVEVKDLTAPVIEGFSKDSITTLGSTVDLSSLKLVDNLDQTIGNTEISVTFNGEAVALTDNKFVADQKGCYVISVKGEDSSGNKVDEELQVFTIIDFEQGRIQENIWYDMEIDESRAYHGNNGAKVHWFDRDVTYVNDGSLLGSDTTILDLDAKYLSFWVYFDGANTGFEQLLIQTKYTYFTTYMFKEYGGEMEHYWQWDFAYEMNQDNWYRMVIDLDECTNICKDPKYQYIDGAKEAKPNPTTFADVMFGFGLWDLGIGGVPVDVVDCYIDDIRLTNTLDDEVYNEEIVVSSLGADRTAQVGDTFNVSATVTPEGNGGVVYSSTNEEVATVTQDGLVTAVGIGQAEIRATSVADPRKSSKLVVTVLEAGAKMPDEANAYHITGNVSVEAWNENSKYYNMFEHAIWDQVCGHCPIFNMQMAHGSYENYSPLTFADGQLFADLENRDGTRINGGWQCFMTDTDALVFAIEAKENVFVKTKENPNGLGGWVSDTVWTILRKNLDGTYTEVLAATQNPTVATITTEWTELQAGESYIIEVKSVCPDLRNFENIPYIDVAPVLVGE